MSPGLAATPVIVVSPVDHVNHDAKRVEQVGMDTTVKARLSLALLIAGGLCVIAGTPVFGWLPRGPAKAAALACLLSAIILLLLVAAKR